MIGCYLNSKNEATVPAMSCNDNSLDGKVALITGSARRLGAHTARALHAAGMEVIIHYRRSREPAQELIDELNACRVDSAIAIAGDLARSDDIARIVEQAAAWRQRLDVLVNNASSFYPTPLGTVDEAQWEDLLGSNLKGPFFLSQAIAPWLRETRGCIVNMVDIHGLRPLEEHPVYSIAKAGNAMMVKALARELGPEVRVNGVAPGAILWPAQGLDDETRHEILQRTTLKRTGSPDDIARAILFLIRDADYVSGQVLVVDGGRTTQQ